MLCSYSQMDYGIGRMKCSFLYQCYPDPPCQSDAHFDVVNTTAFDITESIDALIESKKSNPTLQ